MSISDANNVGASTNNVSNNSVKKNITPIQGNDNISTELGATENGEKLNATHTDQDQQSQSNYFVHKKRNTKKKQKSKNPYEVRQEPEK